MLPVELAPSLATLPASELAALLIAVSEARQTAGMEDCGEIIVNSKRYQWQVGKPKTAEDPAVTEVMHINPAPTILEAGIHLTPL